MKHDGMYMGRKDECSSVSHTVVDEACVTETVDQRENSHSNGCVAGFVSNTLRLGEV